MTVLIDFSVIGILILGISQFRDPRRARRGNLMAALALFGALVLVLFRNGVMEPAIVFAALLAGAAAGYAVARAVGMIQIPAMVAFQHGAGGVAAFLVALVELSRAGQSLDPVGEISGILGLAVGALTFSGSMIASAKLANKMRQAPQILPAHGFWAAANLAAVLAVGIAALQASPSAAVGLYIVEILLSISLGILFSIRVGGADMPVMISFLNATAGLAASLCGMVIGNQLLIAFGATVAASGSILTHVMCKAMNRHLLRVFFPRLENPRAVPKTAQAPVASAASIGSEVSGETRPPGNRSEMDRASGMVEASVENSLYAKPHTLVLQGDARKTVPRLMNAVEPGESGKPDPGHVESSAPDNRARAAEALLAARKVVIVPGYGMALAKAQFKVAELASVLVSQGVEVKYAIHPVAGRMPGHMHVLLAEAEVDYGDLLEMDEANPLFEDTDVALVVGACDVVNPAALDKPGTPLSGMPILMAHKAAAVIVCNLDDQPGYSGVPNPLYGSAGTILMLGDAGVSVGALLASVETAELRDR